MVAFCEFYVVLAEFLLIKVNGFLTGWYLLLYSRDTGNLHELNGSDIRLKTCSSVWSSTLQTLPFVFYSVSSADQTQGMAV